MKFVGIVNANDAVREKSSLPPTVVFWENVEGVLTDKTNAFGCFIASLAGLDAPIFKSRWENAGLLCGPKRNVAWRVLDAKYFGLPQQRRRLYVVAGGKEFHPEEALFGKSEKKPTPPSYRTPLVFEKAGHRFEIFREYTDCLYAAYGTKWNGNAAATNGSLFVVQDSRLRRFSPLEAERLMGLPDRYTDLPGCKKTKRYQAVGNSWAVPVVRWIGERLLEHGRKDGSGRYDLFRINQTEEFPDGSRLCVLKDFSGLKPGKFLNCGAMPENARLGDMRDILCADAPEDIYLSPVGCHGILRRKSERGLSINPRLEEVLQRISSEMPKEEIEARSKIQRRGKFSK